MIKQSPKSSSSFVDFVRKHRLLTNLLLAAVGFGLSLIITEFALRSIIPLNPDSAIDFRIPHPRLGWVLEPDASYLNELSEATVSVTINSEGWRDVEHTIEKPPGVFRILVLGDSFMEANSVELNDAFHRRVEELARAAGRDTEVINMGVGGYGTLQEYLVFRDIGRLYEPDLVLLGFYPTNDLTNDSPELAAVLSADGQVPRTRPYLEPNEPTRWQITPVDFELAQRLFAENRALLNAQRNEITESLILLRVARAAITRVVDAELLGTRVSRHEPLQRERQEMALLGVNYCVEPAEYTRAWDITERILAKLKEDVEAVGSQLVVFTVPALHEVSAEYMDMVVSNAENPDRLCLEEAPGHARLNLILNERDIEFIPLLPDFRRVMREDGIQLFRLSDQHWNPAGHSLAADLVVSELVRRELLPASGTQVPLVP